MDRTIRKLGARKRAPNPDGIPGTIWALAMRVGEMKSRMMPFFTSCLKTGMPICLLDEAGKLSERIIHASSGTYSRVVPRSTLSNTVSGKDSQAWMRFCASGPSWRSSRGGELAMSLDIANAFNYFPWDQVEAGSAHFKVAPHLVSIIRDYFRGKRLEFRNKAEL
ncbi:uncharacterized protein LOC116850250 [Odontomachus brunneus]|uniref:uncharacterized protein LOC116850250 n=1 Tax=Odontomachus brunneus TaxID=486640 RepID=UPI0013F1AB3B|nr:uncharacterized protein LOC116850250 [Odontomachus brunneus]